MTNEIRDNGLALAHSLWSGWYQYALTLGLDEWAAADAVEAMLARVRL